MNQATSDLKQSKLKHIDWNIVKKVFGAKCTVEAGVVQSYTHTPHRKVDSNEKCLKCKQFVSFTRRDGGPSATSGFNVGVA